MAMSDICKCEHARRFHHYNGCNPYPETCECQTFEDPFALVVKEDSLETSLAEIRQMMDEMRAVAAPLIGARQECLAEVESLKKAMQEANDRANKIQQDLNKFDAKLRQAEAAAEQAKRKIEQQRALRAAEAEFHALQEQFDRLTAGAPWREWAFDYQLEDAKKIAAVVAKAVQRDDEMTQAGMLVGNGMRTGKTLTSLIACDMIQAKKILVIAPTTVMREFALQSERWAPHREVILLGEMTKAERRMELKMVRRLDNCIVIMNYEMTRKDYAFIDDLVSAKFDAVILDEAHNIKNIKSLAFRQMKQLLHSNEYRPPVVIPMTGTPILNKPQDLFPLLNLIAPDQFMHVNYFLQDYCTQDWQTGKWKFSTTGLEGLQRKLRDKFMRRTKEQTGRNVIPPQEIIHEIPLDAMTHPAQFAANKALNDQAVIWLEENEDKSLSVNSVIALITRKRQMMTWPAGIKWTHTDSDGVTTSIFNCDVRESVKMDYVLRPNGDEDAPSWDDPAGLLADLNEEKAIVFSQFTTTLDEMKRRCDLAGIHAEIIDGRCSQAKKAEIIANFQSTQQGTPGSVDVILGNYKAIGAGVTLNAASQTIIFDEEWNPGKRDQAYERQFDFDKEGTIHVLRIENSIDGWMASVIEEKEKMIGGFNDKMDLAGDLLAALKNGLL